MTGHGRLEFGHLTELCDDVRGGVRRIERAVDRVDVHRDAAELAPRAEPLIGGERGADVAGCVECVDTGGVAAGGLGVDVLELAFNTGRDHELWVQAVGAQWAKEFGLEVVFKSDGPAPYFEAIELGTLAGPYRLGWSTDFPHAMSFLGPLFVGDSNNTAGYNSQTVTEAAAKLMQMENPYDEQGSQMVSIITDQLNEDMPIVPVYADLSARLLSDAVSDVHLNLDGSVRLKDAILTK